MLPIKSKIKLPPLQSDPKYPKKKYSMKPTPRQKAIWEMMLAHQKAHCIPPTIREIQSHFKFSSTQAVTCHFESMVKKGMIMNIKGKGQWHAFLAVYPDERCPCCGLKPVGHNLAGGIAPAIKAISREEYDALERKGATLAEDD
jgi:SOS-response transcriptional repressor LexA